MSEKTDKVWYEHNTVCQYYNNKVRRSFHMSNSDTPKLNVNVVSFRANSTLVQKNPLRSGKSPERSWQGFQWTLRYSALWRRWLMSGSCQWNRFCLSDTDRGCWGAFLFSDSCDILWCSFSFFYFALIFILVTEAMPFLLQAVCMQTANICFKVGFLGRSPTSNKVPRLQKCMVFGILFSSFTLLWGVKTGGWSVYWRKQFVNFTQLYFKEILTFKSIMLILSLWLRETKRSKCETC